MKTTCIICGPENELATAPLEALEICPTCLPSVFEIEGEIEVPQKGKEPGGYPALEATQHLAKGVRT